MILNQAVRIGAMSLGIFQSLICFANDGCIQPKTPYDQTYCTAKLFLESDKELNSTYQEFKKTLKSEQKEKLTAVQKKWISFRDTTCSAGGTINVDCNYRVNQKRTEFFRDRVRECKTGHCRTDLFFSEEFSG